MKDSTVQRLRSALGRWIGGRQRRETVVGRPGKIPMYQPQKVRLFIKPFCGWCAQAMDWLDEQKIAYEVLDVTEDRKSYEEMYRLSGQTLAPVIEVDGRILADFGARELADFWKTLGGDRG